ncbi:hypothetical protein EV06_0186 [Prochlorococcus sp. MIT 0602]|nr:hypothetical protein EV07_1374 [Prochlorococcus sp. MIT 0603]KGG18058.1 hypothetical protein EV06_0186 [Prochlorococcus sp. MIT 0602]
MDSFTNTRIIGSLVANVFPLNKIKIQGIPDKNLVRNI